MRWVLGSPPSFAAKGRPDSHLLAGLLRHFISSRCSNLYISNHATIFFFFLHLTSIIIPTLGEGQRQKMYVITTMTMTLFSCPHPLPLTSCKKNCPLKNVPLFPHLIASDGTYGEVLCKVVWLLQKPVCYSLAGCGPGEAGPKLTDGPSRGSVAAVFVPNTTRARCPSSGSDHLAPTSSGCRPREKRRANIRRSQ